MGFIIFKGGLNKAGVFVLLVMWIPGIVSLGYRTIARIGFHDIGWKLGPIKYWFLAFFIPFLVAAVSYPISWFLGISEFRLPSPEMLNRNEVETAFELVFKVYPLSFLMGCFAALGEELGWRGFLIPKLYSAGWKKPLMASSFIWGVWHFPLILWGGYASSDIPIISVLLFMVIITLAGVFVGWLRMISGSVWVAMVYHAAHNFFLQTAFEVFNKPGPTNPYFSGESGVIPCLVYLVILFVLYKSISKKSFR